jgi:hypothetical protein
MSNYKRKEILDYLTRKPSTTEDIELARTRIQTPVTPLPMPVASNEGLETREGFKDGNFARGFEHKSFIPLTEEQREIAKKVYGLKESEIDSWQTDRANRKKKASIVSGETTLETKYVSKNYDPNRIIVQSPRTTDEVTNIIFPNKQIEKSFKKDVKERFTVPQGQSEKNLEYFSKNYPLSKRQAFKAVDYIKNEMGLEYPQGSVKADIEKNKRGLLQSTSEPSVESYVRQKIKQPILEKQNLIRKIDLAHRISKEHMKYLGLQFNTRTTGFDSRLINQVIIRPSEIILDKLYKKQRNVMDAIKEKGITDELSKQLEDINDKVRIEAKKTNGRLIGVTIDPETLDPYFEGKKAKLGLTNKILNIKEIAEMPIDKKVKFLTNQITPRIQAEIDRGFTPNDFKEILSDPDRQKSIIKYAEKYTPDIVEDVKKIIKNPTSTKSLPLYTDPTGLGNFLETSVGQGLSKSAPNLLKTTAKLSAITGTPINALLGVALYADEFKEKGLGDLETIAAGAYKGSTQDLLNFGDLIFRKLPVATYEKFVEDKPFLESLLDKPEYFEFADKQIDKYASEKSIKDRIQNMAEYEVRKSVIPNVSDTEVPTTTTSEEYKNLVQNKVGEILNLNPDLKKQYKQETTLVPEPKKDPSQNLMLGPIVFPKYTQEELNFARGGRVKFASGSDDPESDLYIPPLNRNQKNKAEGIIKITEKRLGPEDSLSKYKSYSEEELLGNIEAKRPNQLQSFSLEDYQLNTMPIFKPKDVAPPKSYSPMPNIYNERREGILELATGGRVGFKDGPKDPTKRKFIKGAGVVGALGVAAKYAPELFTTIKKAAKGAGKILPKVTGMPEWFPSLVAKIEKEGKYMNKDTGLADNLKIKQLTIQSKTEKGASEVYTMIQHPNGDIVIEANVKGGAFDAPFELHYKPPKTDMDVTTGTPIKEPGEFNVMENRPRSTAASHHDADYEIDYDLVSYDQAISDVERAERVATGKRIDPRKVQKREAARKYVEENPYDDIVNRYGDSEIEYDQMKDAGLLDEIE